MEMTVKTYNPLIDKVCEIFRMVGFSTLFLEKGCFDIIAKKGNFLLFVKVANELDSFKKYHAIELKKISFFFKATPLLVVNIAEDDVVYRRYGIVAINVNTLRKILLDTPIFIMSERGGYYVRISQENLRRIREQRNYSLRDLANLLGVSRKAVYEYERGESKVSLEVAKRLYDLFGESIIEPINVFEEASKYTLDEKEEFGVRKEVEVVYKKFENLGFKTLLTRYAPFDFLARYKSCRFLTKVNKEIEIEKLSLLNCVSKILRSYAVVITRKDKEVECSMRRVSIIQESLLKEFENAEDFIKIIEHSKEI